MLSGDVGGGYKTHWPSEDHMGVRTRYGCLKSMSKGSYILICTHSVWLRVFEAMNHKNQFLTLLIGMSFLLVECGKPIPIPKAHISKIPSRISDIRSPQRIIMDPIKLQAIPGGQEPEIEIFDAAMLFEQGGRFLAAKKYREALQAYDTLLAHFPDSRFYSPALYNAGLSHEWLGDYTAATERYRELIRRDSISKDTLDASFRLGGCYAELRNWQAAADAFSAILQNYNKLTASDRIEALARQGLAYFRLGDHPRCNSSLRAVIELNKQIEPVERLDNDFFLAMAYYYLSASSHLNFRNTKIDTELNMAQSLEEKARLLLLAQAGYLDTIKVKNPYWATAAGFQIGSLYKEFYTVLLLTIPDFNQQAQKNAILAKISLTEALQQLIQVYREEVHKSVKLLLTKAIRIFEKNVLIGEQIGLESNWVGKSRYQINELKYLLSLSPAEAVKWILSQQVLPEDQASSQGDADLDYLLDHSQPIKPDPSLDPENEEPGRVVL